MKKFGEGQQPFKAIMDIPEGDSQELTTVTDQALNSLYGELFNLLQLHGINPTTTTSADLKQVARAVWSAVNAGNLFIDNGNENNKTLTHTRGDKFLFKSSSLNDDGFIIEFINKTANTGAVFVNVVDVENNSYHFTNIPLVDSSGAILNGGAIQKNTYVKAYYDKANSRFICITINNDKITDSNIYTAENIPLRNAAINTVNSVSELKSLVASENRLIYAKSYNQGQNAGGEFFVLATTSKQSDNAMVFDSSDVGKKWLRVEQNILTPEMFGAKPNDPSFDNTNALNKAFATGRAIYGNPADIYYVDGILESQGQELIGGWKISTSRYSLGVVSTTNHTPSVNDYIRMLYLESAYDLAELLHIKALGFNMINHYGYFANIGNDASGSFDKLLNNCKTAGLKVNVGTESDEAKASIDSFIKKYQAHPNVWGFASWDEGMQRGFNIADQDGRIALIKKYTKKPVTIVDFTSNPFTQVFSENYDYVFVNSYSGVHTNTTDLNNKVNQDLSNMRLQYGCVKGMTRCKNTIPALGLFAYKPEANIYAKDIDQIILAGREFAKSGNGNYAVFVWDGTGDTSITSNVRDNQRFKYLAIELSQFASNNEQYETDVLLFGGSNTDTIYPITDLFDKLPVLDKNTTDQNVASNMYPMVIKPSTNGTETQREHLVNQQTYAGFGMKGNYCAILLNQKVRKYFRAKLDYGHLVAAPTGLLEVLTSGDNGYTPTLLFQDGFSGNKLFDFLSKPANENHHLIIRMTFNNDTASADKYRKFLRGLIVCSDW